LKFLPGIWAAVHISQNDALPKFSYAPASQLHKVFRILHAGMLYSLNSRVYNMSWESLIKLRSLFLVLKSRLIPYLGRVRLTIIL
jgi:hypothetical protein